MGHARRPWGVAVPTHLFESRVLPASVEGEEGDAKRHDEKELEYKPLGDVLPHLEDDEDERADGGHDVEQAELLQPEEQHAHRHHVACLARVRVCLRVDLVAWREWGTAQESKRQQWQR